MSSRCPANGYQDRYEVSLTTDTFIAVEEILQFAEEFRSVKAFQENITQAFADRFSARVVTYGTHSKVRTKCECSPQ